MFKLESLTKKIEKRGIERIKMINSMLYSLVGDRRSCK